MEVKNNKINLSENMINRKETYGSMKVNAKHSLGRDNVYFKIFLKEQKLTRSHKYYLTEITIS